MNSENETPLDTTSALLILSQLTELMSIISKGGDVLAERIKEFSDAALSSKNESEGLKSQTEALMRQHAGLKQEMERLESARVRAEVYLNNQSALREEIKAEKADLLKRSNAMTQREEEVSAREQQIANRAMKLDEMHRQRVENLEASEAKVQRILDAAKVA